MKKTIEELQSEATAKGIKFDRRWGAKKLQRKINGVVVSNDDRTIVVPAVVEKQEAREDNEIPEAKQYKIQNLSKHRYEIGRFAIKSMEIAGLSKEQLADDYLMKRVFHHVEIGKFKVID